MKITMLLDIHNFRGQNPIVCGTIDVLNAPACCCCFSAGSMVHCPEEAERTGMGVLEARGLSRPASQHIPTFTSRQRDATRHLSIDEPES